MIFLYFLFCLETSIGNRILVEVLKVSGEKFNSFELIERTGKYYEGIEQSPSNRRPGSKQKNSERFHKPLGRLLLEKVAEVLSTEHGFDLSDKVGKLVLPGDRFADLAVEKITGDVVRDNLRSRGDPFDAYLTNISQALSVDSGNVDGIEVQHGEPTIPPCGHVCGHVPTVGLSPSDTPGETGCRTIGNNILGVQINETSPQFYVYEVQNPVPMPKSSSPRAVPPSSSRVVPALLANVEIFSVAYKLVLTLVILPLRPKDIIFRLATTSRRQGSFLSVEQFLEGVFGKDSGMFAKDSGINGDGKEDVDSTKMTSPAFLSTTSLIIEHLSFHEDQRPVDELIVIARRGSISFRTLSSTAGNQPEVDGIARDWYNNFTTGGVPIAYRVVGGLHWAVDPPTGAKPLLPDAILESHHEAAYEGHAGRMVYAGPDDMQRQASTGSSSSSGISILATALQEGRKDGSSNVMPTARAGASFSNGGATSGGLNDDTGSSAEVGQRVVQDNAGGQVSYIENAMQLAGFAKQTGEAAMINSNMSTAKAELIQKSIDYYKRAQQILKKDLADQFEKLHIRQQLVRLFHIFLESAYEHYKDRLEKTRKKFEDVTSQLMVEETGVISGPEIEQRQALVERKTELQRRIVFYDVVTDVRKAVESFLEIEKTHEPVVGRILDVVIISEQLIGERRIEIPQPQSRHQDGANRRRDSNQRYRGFTKTPMSPVNASRRRMGVHHHPAGHQTGAGSHPSLPHQSPTRSANFPMLSVSTDQIDQFAQQRIQYERFVEREHHIIQLHLMLPDGRLTSMSLVFSLKNRDLNLKLNISNKRIGFWEVK